MTTVNSTTSTTGTAATTAAAGKSMSSLGINDFITLMTTQLKYQDPTNPQDSTAFVAQLAQFSSVSGIQSMNTSITSLLSEMRSSQAVSATALVGHDVLVTADTAAVTSGDSVSGMIDTPTGTTAINMTVTDASGQVIRQFSVPAVSGGSSFTWDGKDDSGAQVASGNYTFKPIASVYGTSQSVTSALTTKIGSVSIDATDNSLLLNTSSLGSISLSDVRQII